MRRILLAWALVACSGDGPGGGDPCAPGDAPTLAIGESVGGPYQPRADGDALTLVHGPQGGFHLEIGLEATGLALEEGQLVTGFLEGTVDGEVLATTAPWLDFACEAGQGMRSVGTLLIYDGTPESLDGRTTRIVAEVTDLEGTLARAEGSFLIRDGG